MLFSYVYFSKINYCAETFYEWTLVNVLLTDIVQQDINPSLSTKHDYVHPPNTYDHRCKGKCYEVTFYFYFHMPFY